MESNTVKLSKLENTLQQYGYNKPAGAEYEDAAVYDEPEALAVDTTFTKESGEGVDDEEPAMVESDDPELEHNATIVLDKENQPEMQQAV